MSWIPLHDLWRHLRASYWFVPSLMMLAAMLLALTSVSLDGWLGNGWLRDLEPILATQPEGARAVLSAIAGSMITVAGVTFSMTMVSVSFAAGQFGPRLIGNFMRDKANQVTLGVFLATFVYCLMVLGSVRNGGPAGDPSPVQHFVPHLSILIALALALACVAVLIFFMHHVPETINVGRITSDLGRQLKRGLAELFPRSGEVSEVGDPEAGASRPAQAPSSPPVWTLAAPLRSTCDGYLQAVDLRAIVQCAARGDLVLRLEYRPGDFVNEGDVLLHALPAERAGEAASDVLRACFSFGRERTVEQNTLYLADQLVEIMGRALSPGMNDPYTAIDCIRWLGSALIEFAERDVAAPHLYDDEGRLRVYVHPIGFEQLAERVFDRSRQYVAGDLNACLAMIRVAGEAAARARDRDRRRCLVEHAERLAADATDLLAAASAREQVARCLVRTRELAADDARRPRLRDEQGWLVVQA